MSGKLIHNLKRKRDDGNIRQQREKDTAEPDGVATIGLPVCKVESHEPQKRARLEPPTKRAVPDGSIQKYDFLKEALLKVQALQAELAALDDDDDNDEEGYDSGSEEDEVALMAFEAEALGFAVCARETMSFLDGQGLSADNPLVVNLRSRLIGKCGQIPI